MSKVSPNQVKAVIADYLTEQAHGAAVYFDADLPDDLDLLSDGLIDSLGLLGLVQELQGRFGESLDFEELDADDLTVIGPLSRFVAAAT
jgi:acyl carrier protein